MGELQVGEVGGEEGETMVALVEAGEGELMVALEEVAVDGETEDAVADTEEEMEAEDVEEEEQEEQEEGIAGVEIAEGEGGFRPASEVRAGVREEDGGGEAAEEGTRACEICLLLFMYSLFARTLYSLPKSSIILLKRLA